MSIDQSRPAALQSPASPAGPASPRHQASAAPGAAGFLALLGDAAEQAEPLGLAAAGSGEDASKSGVDAGAADGVAVAVPPWMAWQLDPALAMGTGASASACLALDEEAGVLSQGPLALRTGAAANAKGSASASAAASVSDNGSAANAATGSMQAGAADGPDSAGAGLGAAPTATTSRFGGSAWAPAPVLAPPPPADAAPGAGQTGHPAGTPAVASNDAAQPLASVPAAAWLASVDKSVPRAAAAASGASLSGFAAPQEVRAVPPAAVQADLRSLAVSGLPAPLVAEGAVAPARPLAARPGRVASEGRFDAVSQSNAASRIGAAAGEAEQLMRGAEAQQGQLDQAPALPAAALGADAQAPMPHGSHGAGASAARAETLAAVATAVLPPLPDDGASQDWVAQQLGLWIGQKVQTAELRLDDRSGEAVEVRIALTGNEAQVEFRSDVAQTRDLLGGAVAQLEDLLKSEGLVLSGVSISSSERGPKQHEGSGGELRQDRAKGAARLEPMSATGALPGPRPAVGGTTGRVLDLFV